MQQERIDTIRMNVLDAGASIVGSVREELLELLDELDAREKTAAEKIAGRVAGIAWQTVDELRAGIRAAPSVKHVYHERLQLLQLFDALDKLADAIHLSTK